MSNPLLADASFPLFSIINSTHVNPALDYILTTNKAKLAAILAQEEKTWDNCIASLEEVSDDLQRVWSQVVHLNAVVNSPELRQEYEIAEQKITEYHTELSHNKELFAAYQTVNKLITDTEATVKKKLLQDAIRDFHLSGVTLDDVAKKQYTQLVKELSELETQFANNVLDCTDAWHLIVTDSAEIAGIPDYILQAAYKDNKYIFDLKAPTYIAIMQYAKNRQLREKFYQAYVTRAADTGYHDKKYDNTHIMLSILQKRSALAQLLGFENYAEKSLAKKMAASTTQVRQFLYDLVTAAKSKAQQEFAILENFAKTQDNLEALQPWDLAYYSEKLMLANFSISDELLRQYFPVKKVLTGLFEVVYRLYDIKVVELPNNEVWHSDVQFFAILDNNSEAIGYFYLDLFARNKKRGGAWMDECTARKKLFPDSELQLPIAYLTCNFTPPEKDKAALLTHDEVITLFHEFGHGLHHLLTKIDYPSIAGINGVPWDGVELPSQFLENWCWQKESLEFISEHLPDDLLAKMLAAKNFQQAMAILRQLEFSLFDFLLHENFDEAQGIAQIENVLNQVRTEVSVVPIAEYNRFANSFSHIFAGGYAAGYYSYLWAEVLAADAFARFREEGIFNHAAAMSFLHNILEQGGSQDFLELFIAFRGRAPSVEALLQDRGIVAS